MKAGRDIDVTSENFERSRKSVEVFCGDQTPEQRVLRDIKFTVVDLKVADQGLPRVPRPNHNMWPLQYGNGIKDMINLLATQMVSLNRAVECRPCPANEATCLNYIQRLLP